MEIKFLKAGSGDAILIHHYNKNILIDGGNETSYLKGELTAINHKGEYIDLLVITHHDDDHISGIIEILNQVESGLYGQNRDFIKQVIFNSPRSIKKIISSNENLLTYSQAQDVENLLLKINTRWDEVITSESNPIFFGDMKLTFLSPDKNILQNYSDNKGALLSSVLRCDWDTPMLKLEKWIDDASQDNSISNKSSIVFLLECEGKKILFTGDVTPDRFAQISDEMFRQNNNSPILIDYMKLPHHGSYRNLNKEILSKIVCFNYIITTNGKNSYLPNKRALLKIIKYLKNEKRNRINFIFN